MTRRQLARRGAGRTALRGLAAGLALTLLVAEVDAQSTTPTAGTGFGGLSFRTIDGSDNNLDHPTWGAAGTELRRDTTVDYADGVSAPAGADRPSARAVSNAVCAQGSSIPNEGFASDFVWQWGQFLDHDIDLTGPAAPSEPFDIEVPLGDPWFDPFSTGTEVIPFVRSLYGPSVVRQQLNEITTWIDASNVYGSDGARALELRQPGGLLKTSFGRLLPFNLNGFPNAPDDDDPSFFLAGDVRANEQVALTAMHTLFVREHNRLVRILRNLGFGPDERYELARVIVGAEMQAITYNEFLPVLLGPDALPPYAGYDPDLAPGIENAFSTASYRFGHSMLSSTLLRLAGDGQPIPAGHLSLAEGFFNPQAILDEGIEPLLRGLASQRAQAVDIHVVDDVRNFLFGPPGSGGLDLASLNMQRGRDHGLPGYNQLRVDYGLAPAASFADVSSDPDVQAALASVYDDVDDIDAWIGGLAEDHVPGALVGELVRVVLAEQFTRLRDGDRFWYEIHLPAALRFYVESSTLSRIIRRNTSIGGELQANVFLTD